MIFVDSYYNLQLSPCLTTRKAMAASTKREPSVRCGSPLRVGVGRPSGLGWVAPPSLGGCSCSSWSPHCLKLPGSNKCIRAGPLLDLLVWLLNK